MLSRRKQMPATPLRSPWSAEFSALRAQSSGVIQRRKSAMTTVERITEKLDEIASRWSTSVNTGVKLHQ
jgi:hypothetical protein